MGEAVGSLLAQTYTHWEMLIVSDDGHDYKETLSNQNINDERLVFLSTGGNGTGPARGRNIAMASARGAVVAFLDADDSYAPDYLALTVPHVLQQGMVKTALVHRYYDDKGYKDHTIHGQHSHGKNAGASLFDYHTQINILARRDLVTFAWREDIHFAEDVVFSLQLCDKAQGFYYEPNAAYFYSLRSGSASNGQHHASSMITLKQYIRSLVAKGEIALQDNVLKHEFLDYYDRSIKLEHQYNEAKNQGEALNFSDFAHKYESAIITNHSMKTKNA